MSESGFPKEKGAKKKSALRRSADFFVEKIGLEPTTSCMPCKRSSQLSDIPVFDEQR